MHRMFYQARKFTSYPANNQEVINSDQSEMNEKCDLPLECRQILLTASPILAAAMKKSYDKLCTTCGIVLKAEDSNEFAFSQNTDNGMDLEHTLLIEEESQLRFDQCGEREPFPVISTYAAFLKMLNRTLSRPFVNKRRSLVTFERFQSHYYPHFSDALKSKMEDSVVFTEIITYIKGSLLSMQYQQGLAEGDYLSKSCSRSSNMNEAQRALVYEAFRKYENLKKEMGEHDRMDMVHHVERELRAGNVSYPFEPLHYVYVDEIQGQIITFSEESCCV